MAIETAMETDQNQCKERTDFWSRFVSKLLLKRAVARLDINLISNGVNMLIQNPGSKQTGRIKESDVSKLQCEALDLIDEVYPTATTRKGFLDQLSKQDPDKVNRCINVLWTIRAIEQTKKEIEDLARSENLAKQERIKGNLQQGIYENGTPVPSPNRPQRRTQNKENVQKEHLYEYGQMMTNYTSGSQ